MNGVLGNAFPLFDIFIPGKEDLSLGERHCVDCGFRKAKWMCLQCKVRLALLSPIVLLVRTVCLRDKTSAGLFHTTNTQDKVQWRSCCCLCSTRHHPPPPPLPSSSPFAVALRRRETVISSNGRQQPWRIRQDMMTFRRSRLPHRASCCEHACVCACVLRAYV